MVAVALGALLGVFLMVASHEAVRFVTPDEPLQGVVVVGALMIARFMVVLTALALFYYFAREGLAGFGIALAGSFVVGLFIEAFRSIAPHASGTSV